MERPNDLQPGRFLKVAYKDGDDFIRMTVVWSYQCYHQTWKQALKFQGGSPTHVDAKHLTCHLRKVNWDDVIAWDYVNFESLTEKFPDGD